MIQEEIYLNELLQRAIYTNLLIDLGLGILTITLIILSIIYLKDS
jgi:hypothetical protein